MGSNYIYIYSYPSSPVPHIVGSWVLLQYEEYIGSQKRVTNCIGNWLLGIVRGRITAKYSGPKLPSTQTLVIRRPRPQGSYSRKSWGGLAYILICRESLAVC